MDPDFTKLIGFEWDAGNSSKSLTKHRVTAQEAEQAFADPNVHVLDDEAHSVSLTPMEGFWQDIGIAIYRGQLHNSRFARESYFGPPYEPQGAKGL